jgi:hypothetical protein
MLHVSPDVTRPIVKALFVTTCLLSVVSWYTTQQGMALYLAPWFAFLASFGVQGALVLVAWLIGFTRAKRTLLIAVYVITAAVSITFSYVSLYTWFSARERPAAIERKLYDELNNATDKAQQLVEASVAESDKHVLALDEMTSAEKTVGHISRAQDADPYLMKVRDAVAKEAQTYSATYREGSGEGLRYTAFDRYAKLTRQALERLQAAQRSLTDLRTRLKPLDPTETQLRTFRQAYDTIPWNDVNDALHSTNVERPVIPEYASFVDRTTGGQEDLMIALEELFTAPTSRHILSFALALFIDVIVFLVAFASGPHLFGSSEQRWLRASASVDDLNEQVFARGLLRKLTPSARGMARVDASELSTGEQQLFLLLVAKGRATVQEDEGKRFYLLDESMQEWLLESVESRGLPLRASAGAGA